MRKHKINPEWMLRLFTYSFIWMILLNMNSQLEKNSIKVEDLGPNIKEIKSRPNIDQLIKRIVTERNREKKNNILMMFLIFSGVAIIALKYL